MGESLCIDFLLALEDGTEVDGTHGEPWCFHQGDGNLVPALEQRVLSLAAGESGTFLIEPGDDAYGFRDESLVFPVARQEFPGEMEPEVGMTLLFDVPSGEELPGTVVEVSGDRVMVDFNHPLAGRALLFQVQRLSGEV